MKDSCLNKKPVSVWEFHAAAIRKEIGQARLTALFRRDGSFMAWVIRNKDNEAISRWCGDDEEAWRDAAERLGVI